MAMERVISAMREVSTRDLKDRLSDWIRRVEQSGVPVVVTRSGRPVAALVPLSDLRTRGEASVLADLAARGAVRVPRPPGSRAAFSGPTVPARGSPAADMVIEDRR
jgi:prevent-host-death family protein